MRLILLSPNVSIDLDEVSAVTWSAWRPQATDACVIVTLRNDHRQYGRWWHGVGSQGDVEAQRLYDKLVALLDGVAL